MVGMRICTKLLLLGGLTLLAGNSVLHAQTWTLPYKSREIRVDGVLNDWEGIPEISLRPGDVATQGQFESNDVAVSLRGVWDEEALYLAVEWQDDVWDIQAVRRRDSVFVTADGTRRNRMYFFDNLKFMLHQLNYSYLLWFSPRANNQGPHYWHRLLAGGKSREAAVPAPVITPRENDGKVSIELLFNWKEMKLKPKKLIKKGMPLSLLLSDGDAPGQILEAKVAELTWLEWDGLFKLAKK